MAGSISVGGKVIATHTGPKGAGTVDLDVNSFKIGGTEVMDGSGNFKISSGTTAERPSSPSRGNIRFNTTHQTLEYFDGTKWYFLNYQEDVTDLMSTAYFWMKPENIIHDGTTISSWEEENNARHFTASYAPSRNDTNVYVVDFANGYKGASAQPNTSSTTTYGGLLIHSASAGYAYDEDWSAVMAINHVVGKQTEYNEGWAVANASSGDGSWSIGPDRIHTWGGGYGEIPSSGTNSFGTTGQGLSIWAFTYNNLNDTYIAYKRVNGQFTQTVNGTGTFPNVTYGSHTLLFFQNASNSSHHAVGILGEYAFFKNTILTSNQLTSIGNYLSYKFGI